MTRPTSEHAKHLALGPRSLLVGGLAAVATFDPSLATLTAPFLAVVVFLFGRPHKFRVGAPVHWGFAFIAWTALSGIWTVNPDHLTATLTRAALMLMFVAVSDFIQSGAHLKAVAAGYLIGAQVAVVRIIFENSGAIETAGGDRVTTVLGNLNVNYIGYVLAGSFPIIVLLWSVTRQRLVRFVLVFSTLVVIVGVEFTGTRGAYLGLGAGVAWIVFWALFKIRSLWTITVALVLASAAIVTGVADQASLVFETGERATGDWSGRLQLWESARSIWASSPFTGVGVGGFRILDSYHIPAHNILLDMGVGLGLVGVLLFALFLRSALWVDTRSVEGRQRALLVGVLIAATGPSYLTGAWDTSPAAWITLAIFARISVLAPANDMTLAFDQEPSLLRRGSRS